jgi:hypothetical protein
LFIPFWCEYKLRRILSAVLQTDPEFLKKHEAMPPHLMRVRRATMPVIPLGRAQPTQIAEKT